MYVQDHTEGWRFLESLVELGFVHWEQGQQTPRCGVAITDPSILRSVEDHFFVSEEAIALYYPFDSFDLFAIGTMSGLTHVINFRAVTYQHPNLHFISARVSGFLDVDRLQAAAYARYALRQFRNKLMPLPDWFVESERQAYESSPKCFIAREEARIFRRMFLEVLSGLDRESEMRVSFRGNVLIVDLGHDYFDARAWGDAWPDTYRVMVSPETKLPARFMSSWVDVTLFDGQVFIGGLSLGPCEAITQDSG